MPARVDVRGMRDRMGLSQIQLADKLGIHERTVRRWEEGRIHPSPMAMANIKRMQQEYNSHTPTGSGGSGQSAPSSSSSPSDTGPSRRVAHLPDDRSNRLAPLAAVLPSLGRSQE